MSALSDSIVWWLNRFFIFLQGKIPNMRGSEKGQSPHPDLETD